MTDPADDLLAAIEKRDGPRRTTRAEVMVYLTAAVIGSVLVMNLLQWAGVWK